MAATRTTKRVRQVIADSEGSPNGAARKMSKKWLWLVAAVVIIGGATAAWWTTSGSGEETATLGAATELRFADVVRANLTELETLDGTLGYTDGEPIINGLPGVVTSVIEGGEAALRGDILYTIDADPVVLMYGNLPAWRTLELEADGDPVVTQLGGTVTAIHATESVAGDGTVLFAIDDEPVTLVFGDLPAWRTMNRRSADGADIEQLEAALVRYGFDPGEDLTVDEDFTSFTEDLVQDWQESIGATDDGAVTFGEIIFSPAEVPIGEALVDVGDTVGPGTPIFATVDTADAPAGNDVLQLEQNLFELGWDAGGTMVVDGIFDEATKSAVMDWQADMGAEVDGIVELGEVVFLPGEVRITDTPTVGATLQSGMTALATTSPQTLVTVNLAAADQDILDVGTEVTIVLPDNSTTPGTVISVSNVATSNAQGPSTFEVEIALADPSAAGTLDEAPVEVEVITDSADNVLAVPVTALLALSEGGYAVEVERPGGQTALVAVEPGFFADGLVEVTSDGLQLGDRVVVP